MIKRGFKVSCTIIKRDALIGADNPLIEKVTAKVRREGHDLSIGNVDFFMLYM